LSHRPLHNSCRMLVRADGLDGRMETSTPLGPHHSRMPALAVLLQYPQQPDALAIALGGHQTVAGFTNILSPLPCPPHYHCPAPTAPPFKFADHTSRITQHVPPLA